MVHVPYRGSTAATMDVIAGTIPMTFVSLGQYMDLVRQGTIRVLGVASAKRVSYMPDLPTFGEQGFPGFEIGTWFALFAPAGLPRARHPASPDCAAPASSGCRRVHAPAGLTCIYLAPRAAPRPDWRRGSG